MPSLAFAGHSCVYPVTVTTNTVKWADLKAALKTDDAKYINVEKEPTHNAAGVAYLTCKEDYCGEVKKVSVLRDKADHVVVQRDLSLQEYADAMVAQKTGDDNFKNTTAAAYWVKTQSKTKCYRENVNVCSCGYVGVSGTNVAHSTVNKKYDCADYTCSKCNAVIEGVEHEANTNTGDFYQGYLRKAVALTIPADKVSEPNCGKGTGYKWTCKHCGEKVAVVYTVDPKTTAHNYGTAVDKSVATEEQASGAFKVKEGYVGVQGATTVNKDGVVDANVISTYKFYQLNHVKTEGSCTADTVKNLKCETCGEVRPNTEQSITAKHDYVETKVPATCDSRSKVKKVCKVCGDEVEDNATTADDTKAHSYKVTKVAATCADDEYYLIECTTCAKDCAHAKGVKIDKDGKVYNLKTGNQIYVADAKVVDTTAKTATYIFTGFEEDSLKGTDVIEVTLSTVAASGDHKPGDKVLLKAATCEGKEVWGKKCVNCGKLIKETVTEKANTALGHDLVKTETAATCGSYGFYTEQCSRCGLYKNADGIVNATDLEHAKVVKTDKPVVKEGAKCTFDKWVVTKDSTVFEEGVKSLECSVCGADGNAKTVIAKKTVAKASNTVKAGKKSFNVKSSAANATGYRVYYKKAGAKSWKSYTKKTASLSKTFSGLSKGKYYVKVKAYAKNYAGDGQVVWGATSSTKSVKVK